MFRIPAIFGALVFTLLFQSRASADVVVEQSELGFSLTLPDGFERITDQENSSDFVRVYRQRSAGQPLAAVFSIERLHGTLPRLDIEKAHANPKLDISTERWNDLDILVARASEVIDGVPAIILNAQIPLKPEAIQLKIVGPATQESRIKDLLRSTLGTLKGETNWLNNEQRSQRLQEGMQRLGITVVILAALAILVVMAFRKMRRRTLV